MWSLNQQGTDVNLKFINIYLETKPSVFITGKSQQKAKTAEYLGIRGGIRRNFDGLLIYELDLQSDSGGCVGVKGSVL